MPLKTYNIDLLSFPVIQAEPLTIEAFRPFGSIISPDEELVRSHNDKGVFEQANYGTAIKFKQVSQIQNLFPQSSSRKKESLNWNIFRCFPQNHLMQYDLLSSTFTYLTKVLERHPYSSQTFLPMGRSTSIEYGYVVVVAQDLDNDQDDTKLPDLNSIKVFICKNNQAVTYNSNTWHAPMIALSNLNNTYLNQSDHIDFAVLIHENGIPNDDCQEVYFESGFKISFKNFIK
ncbi:ureidoglycolate hydrolase [Ascoidea rubescens DSM 1968]|uniref:Ureidoglycolate hydrolase n=1 Tax=Ascoidea rubescens DSM 1968 TaxID=1344418 RepID=A0A1D2VJL8_9ASCO|nr:ureidoglycolate hydrolase [Ascoidea rubescens DSM 1968]ODV61809.1 ureidoglycolate hydrolase [Ascoidea rubescens DSM 1968]